MECFGVCVLTVGNPRDQMTEFVTIFSSLQVGFLKYLDLYLMEFFLKRRVYRENQALSGGVSAILQSGQIIANIRRMFFVKIHGHCPGDPD